MTSNATSSFPSAASDPDDRARAWLKDVVLVRPYFAFVLNELDRHFPGRKDVRVLDYGCGDGGLVKFLLLHGYDAYGVDVDTFFDDFYSHTDRELLSQNRIAVIDKEGRGAMSGRTFDFVVSHMVIEHVQDKRRHFAAMSEYMNSSSIALLLYPVRESMREGHIRQFFIHWFPQGPVQLALARFQKALGIPADNAEAPSCAKYLLDRLLTVNRDCFYESNRAMDRYLREKFTFAHLEHEYFVFRARHKGKTWLVPLLKLLYKLGMSGLLFRLYTGAVVEARVAARGNRIP